MNMIAIESSTRICSVSSFIGGNLINVIETDEPRSHSKNLPLMIKAIIRDFNSIKDIDAISISIGPGSFTSLRISMSLVKGLAFGLKTNIIPVPTLASINFKINDADSHYVLLDSYKNQCFVQKFKGNKPSSPPYIESIDNLTKIKSKFYGYSEKIEADIFKLNIVKPSSILIGKFAISKMNKLLKKYDSDIKLIYLSKNEYIKINDNKGRK